MQPFRIYIFKKGQVLYGASKCKTSEVDEVLGYGFRLEKDPSKTKKMNYAIFIRQRAKREVIARVSNALNAVLLYGKEVIKEDGSIDWELFRQKELNKAEELIQKQKEFKRLNGETEEELEERMLKTFESDREEFEKESELFTFKTEEISIVKAKELNLI